MAAGVVAVFAAAFWWQFRHRENPTSTPVALAGASVAMPAPATPQPTEAKQTNPLLAAAAEEKRNSQQPPRAIAEQMKRNFVKVYANKSKYSGMEVMLDVYLFSTADIAGKLYGFASPTYPDVAVGYLTCNLAKLDEDKKELAISSSGKVLTIAGKIEKDKALGLVLCPTDVRLSATSNWNGN